MGVNHLFWPKHHRPKLVRPKEPENVVVFHLVREELAEVEELMLLLALELGLDLGRDHRHLKHQLLIANVVELEELMLLLALELDLEVELGLDHRHLKHQLLIANVVVVVSVWTEVKGQKLSLLPLMLPQMLLTEPGKIELQGPDHHLKTQVQL